MAKERQPTAIYREMVADVVAQLTDWAATAPALAPTQARI